MFYMGQQSCAIPFSHDHVFSTTMCKEFPLLHVYCKQHTIQNQKIKSIVDISHTYRPEMLSAQIWSDQ